MLTKEAKEELERQQYRVVGEHSAVKVCGWTKNMIKGQGGCYKLKFYGIMSHQCMQMTTSISCANRCSFCWRGYKAPVAKEWKWGVDDPQMILDESLKNHHDLLVGFKGNEKAIKPMYKQSNTVKHVALSLTGEPIIYPKMNAMMRLFNKKGISTFLVTNAQYPDQIRDLAPVTQLYVSLDAPEKKLLKIVDVPLFRDYWERLMQSLDYLAAKKQRTCIRLTCIKDLNMVMPEKYAALIKKGDPDFIELKAYMHVGASQKRLKRENMPDHSEVVAWTWEVLKYLPEYELVSEHIPSRVVMCAKKSYLREGKWMTWIDFPRYAEIAMKGNEFTTEDYLKETPAASIGISGKDTPTKEEAIAAKEKREAQNQKLRAKIRTKN